MTNQEAFDTVARWLLRPDFRRSTIVASNANTRCVYRGGDGNRCAIGVLIPDSEYRADLEGKSVYDVRVNHLPSLQGLNPVMLNWLQKTHDERPCLSPDDDRARRIRQLRSIADDYNLSAAVVDEMEARQ